MGIRFSPAAATGVETEAPEWEPEPLPLTEQLDYPPPSPRHDDAHDSDRSSRVVVIDLA